MIMEGKRRGGKIQVILPAIFACAKNEIIIRNRRHLVFCLLALLFAHPTEPEAVPLVGVFVSTGITVNC